MSKLSNRVALSVLISLMMIAGIYFTVFGAPAEAPETRAGTHLVSGSKVNLDHYRSADPAPAAPLQSEYQGGKGGGGCEHEMQTSPED
jgi:hypothetical protein